MLVRPLARLSNGGKKCGAGFKTGFSVLGISGTQRSLVERGATYFRERRFFDNKNEATGKLCDERRFPMARNPARTRETCPSSKQQKSRLAPSESTFPVLVLEDKNLTVHVTM